MKFQKSFGLLLLQTFCFAQIIKIPLRRSFMDQDWKMKNRKNPRLLSSDSEILLYKNNSLQTNMYTGKVIIGDFQLFNVAFDTTSSSHWIVSSELSYNKTYIDVFEYGKGYKSLNQDHSQKVDKQSIERDQPYASTKIITSVNMYDIKKQADQQEFYLVDYFGRKPYNPLKIGGTIGLGCYQVSNCLVVNLYNLKSISQPTFSFYFDNNGGDSELLFGGFNSEKIADTSKIFYFNCDCDQNNWNVQVNSYNFFGQIINNQNSNVYIDSSSQYIRILSDQYQSFQNNLNKLYVINQDNDGNMFINCSENLPDIEISIVDTQGVRRDFTIPKSYYLYNTGEQNKCLILIRPISDDLQKPRLGGPFLKRYVSIYSYNNKTIAFTLASNSQESNNWILYPIIIGCILFVGIILFLLWKYIVKRRKQKSQSDVQEQLSKLNVNSSSCENTSQNYSLDEDQRQEINIQKNLPPNQNLNINQQQQQQKLKKKNIDQRTF